MSLQSRAIASAAAVALASSLSLPALAAGTLAGTTVSNNASVTYKVNTVSQSAIAAPTTVTVDRVISMTGTLLSAASVDVTPGQTGVVSIFRATNTSNAPISLAPSIGNSSYKNFNAIWTGPFRDSNNNGTYEAGTDLPANEASTNLPVIDPDASLTFFMVADIPASVLNKQKEVPLLHIKAREPNTGGNLLTANITQTTGANTSGIDTVLNDPGYAYDFSKDGKISLDGELIVATASLAAVRRSTVISDPVNGTTNPKLIPGAIVENCIVVSNAADAVAANSLAIADTVSPTLTYDATFGVYQNGTVDGTTGACKADGTKAGTFASGVATGTIGTLDPGQTKTVYYRGTVK